MAEREWREAGDDRPSTIPLALVIVAGAALRLIGLDTGIPFAIGVDEPEIMSRVVHMMKTGDFNPHFFDYPSLYFYLQLAAACLRFVAGATNGQWQSLDQVGAADFYLWGRALTAFFGIATIVVVHNIGMRWGARHGLLAAGLMAVLPLHVRESHYVLTDVPMTFFTMLAFLLSLRAHERAQAGGFTWAGVAAGLAAGTKYNGALVLLLPLIAAWMTLAAKPSRLRCALGAVGGFAGAFLVAAPYTLLDLPAFLNGYAHLAGYYRPRTGGDAPWLLYLKHFRLQVEWPMLLLTIAGLILGIVRATRGPAGRVRWTLLVTFPIVYFYLLATKSLVFARYMLPMLPFTCILAAIAVVSGVTLLRRFEIPRAARTALIAGLTIAAVLPPAISAVRFVRDLTRPSTQDAAYLWIIQNIPAGARIAIEKYDIRLPEPRYRPEHVVRLTDFDLDEYKRRGIQYLIASDQVFGPAFDHPEEQPSRYQAYMRLFEQSTELARMEPGHGRVGPRLWIYKVGR